jgi:transposase-like protein
MEALKTTTFRRFTRYSDAFKRKVVKEYEQGRLNKNDLQRKYGISGKSAVLEWCKKFGKLADSSSGNQPRTMKDPKDKRIKELEKKLKDAELKLLVYDKLIEVTNRQLDADIIKKIEAKLSESWQQDKK